MSLMSGLCRQKEWVTQRRWIHRAFATNSSPDKLAAIFPGHHKFANRHIGPRKDDSKKMLNSLGYRVRYIVPQAHKNYSSTFSDIR